MSENKEEIRYIFKFYYKKEQNTTQAHTIQEEVDDLSSKAFTLTINDNIVIYKYILLDIENKVEAKYKSI